MSWALLADAPDFDFCDWHNQPRWAADNDTACQQMIDLLHREGHQVYIAEYRALGAYACRILVPQFSEIYAVDELIWHNNNQALPVRPLLFGIHRAGRDGWQRLLDTLDEHNLNDQLRVLEWAGVAADKTSAWGRLRVGELRLWLALALQDLELAFELVPLILQSGHLTDDERLRYRAVFALLEIQQASDNDDWLAPYRRALSYYYGDELLERALRWVQGIETFPDLDDLDAQLPTAAHEKLIAAYRKVLAAQ